MFFCTSLDYSTSGNGNNRSSVVDDNQVFIMQHCENIFVTLGSGEFSKFPLPPWLSLLLPTSMPVKARVGKGKFTYTRHKRDARCAPEFGVTGYG